MKKSKRLISILLSIFLIAALAFNTCGANEVLMAVADNGEDIAVNAVTYASSTDAEAGSAVLALLNDESLVIYGVILLILFVITLVLIMHFRRKTKYEG